MKALGSLNGDTIYKLRDTIEDENWYGREILSFNGRIQPMTVEEIKEFNNIQNVVTEAFPYNDLKDWRLKGVKIPSSRSDL